MVQDDDGTVAVAPPSDPLLSSIPLSADLAKVWDHVELDEDTVDGYVVISSEKDMSPLIHYYNEHKRRMNLMAPLPPKRVKTDNPMDSRQKTEHTLNNTTHAIFLAQPQQTKQQPQQQSMSLASFSSITNFSTPSPSSSLPGIGGGLSQETTGKVLNHTIIGTATNGFAVVPLQGMVEGGEEGFLVEFVVQGHTYRGFLMARDAYPSLISPLVTPTSTGTGMQSGTSSSQQQQQVGQLARLTATAVHRHHAERLSDLGRLVVASALVPYAFPPPLHL